MLEIVLIVMHIEKHLVARLHWYDSISIIVAILCIVESFHFFVQQLYGLVQKAETADLIVQIY